MYSLLDLYSDYLLGSFGRVSSVNLSSVLEGSLSHDKITRFLSFDRNCSKDLWKCVKPLVRSYETDEGCLIFDDTIIEKAYSSETDLINWHWDHSKGRSVKGINLLTCFYHTFPENLDAPLRVPVEYKTILKTVRYTDSKTGKEKRKSPITKNELLRDMFRQSLRKGIKFKYVLADSWFASTENMRLIHKKKKFFIFDMKQNRQAVLSETDRNQGAWKAINTLNIPDNTPVKVWLKGLEIPVLLIKQVFTNKDDSTGMRFLVSNDLTLSNTQFESIYKKRWSVEEYHKSLKQNTAIDKSSNRTVKTQSNHIFCSIVAYVKLEKMKLKTKLNHFAMKTKIQIKAIQQAMKQLIELRQFNHNA